MPGCQTKAWGVVVRDVGGFVGDEIAISKCASHDAGDDVRKGRDLIQADECVYFWQEIGQFLGKALGETSCNNQFLFLGVFASFLGLGDSEDSVDGFLFGFIDERTGVDDDDICQIRIGRHGHSGLLEVADHDFGVVEILGASKGDESYGNWHGCSV